MAKREGQALMFYFTRVSNWIPTSSGARCWWRSWLRHCATSRKVAGLNPDGVIGFFFIDIILLAALWPWV
jgi:hypothetical protein